MVSLDHGLIHRATTFITGANVHRGKGMIFAYEQAVQLHNAGRPGHAVYQSRYENELREFTQHEARVHAAGMKDLNERSSDAIQHAKVLLENAYCLHRRCEDLDTRVKRALLLCGGSAVPPPPQAVFQ